MLALLCLLVNVANRSSAAAATPERPNFVVIQTDDQTLDQLYAAFGQGGTLQAMPNTLNLIAKGVRPSTATTSPTRSAAPRGSAC